MIRAVIAVPLVLAAAGAAASVTADAARDASTVIRPGRSIGGFQLGMTDQQ